MVVNWVAVLGNSLFKLLLWHFLGVLKKITKSKDNQATDSAQEWIWYWTFGFHKSWGIYWL